MLEEFHSVVPPNRDEKEGCNSVAHNQRRFGVFIEFVEVSVRRIFISHVAQIFWNRPLPIIITVYQVGENRIPQNSLLPEVL